MANDIIFQDFSIEVKKAIEKNINSVLAECAGEMASATKRNTRVDTGKTKNSWSYYLDLVKHIAYIGSPLENAIWEEFGTGEHALAGNGRKGGWAYQDAEGEWHFTHGKKPSRAFFKAYTMLKNKIIKRIQNSFKGL